MSTIGINSVGNVNISAGVTKVAPKAQEVNTQEKSVALQSKDSNSSTAKTGSVPKVNVLAGAKAGAAQGAKVGAIAGVIGGAGLGLLAGGGAWLATGGSTSAGWKVGLGTAAVVTGISIAGGAAQGAASGAIYSKVANGNSKKGAMIGAVVGGALGAIKFKDGAAQGAVAVGSGALIGYYLGKKATEASIK